MLSGTGSMNVEAVGTCIEWRDTVQWNQEGRVNSLVGIRNPGTML